MNELVLRLAGHAALAPLPPSALVAPTGMARWPRLDRYGQALSAAVAQAISALPQALAATTGLYVASAYSCFETNALFHHGLIDKGPQLASPLLFPYTLPGAAAAEVAMHFGLGGEHLVFTGGPATALAALLSARDALEESVDGSLILASADVLGAERLQTQAACDAEVVANTDADPPPSEAAVALCFRRVEPSGSPAAGPRRFAIEGAVGSAPRCAEDWLALTRRALDRCRVTPSALTGIYSATVAASTRRDEARAARLLAPRLEIQPVAAVHGDAGASLGLLAARRAIIDGGAILIFAADRGGATTVVIKHEA